MRRTWEIAAHTFPIVWVLFSIRFTFFSILYNMRNTWVSPSVSCSMGKCSEIHRGNWYPFFPWRMDTFRPSESHLLVYFTTWEMHGFSQQFLITRENVAKLTLWAFWLFFYSILCLLVPESIDFLKEKTEKKRYGKLVFLKNKNQFQARWNSKQNLQKKKSKWM